LEPIELLLQDAERATAGLEASAEAQHIAGHVTTIRAYVALLRGDERRGAELARRALELLPENDLAVRGFAATQLAYALRTSEGLEAATRATVEASAIGRAAGDSHVAVMTLCDLAGLLRLQGRLHEAADTYREALELAHKYAQQSGRQLPITGYVHGRMSTVLLEWNDLDAAVRLAKQGVEMCRQWGWTEPFVDCCVYLASALQATGDGQGALDTLGEAERAARGLSPWYADAIEVFEVWTQLEQGDLATPALWAAAQEGKLSLKDEPDSKHAARYLALVRVLITQAWAQSGEGRDRVSPAWEDKLRRALEILARLLQTAETEDQVMRAIEILILRALALQTLGRIDQALAALAQAISIAEPGGYVRIFVAKGSLMKELLRKAAARGVAADYVNKLLAAFREDGPVPLAHSPSLIEPLTKRELEVLRLIAAGLSNREIAGELFLAVGTVKKYTSNIYGKLSVRKRIQAVARARELGLLQV
jgi:LuxR family maltose regulon positive regulatory protein